MSSESFVVKLAYVFITAHVVLAYPIPLNPLSLQLERLTGIDKKTGTNELVARCISRTCLVLTTMFIASVVPYFGDILQLVSSLSMTMIAFILPPLFYFLLYRSRYHGFSYSELGIMLLIAVCGVLCMVIGIYYAIKGLLESIEANPNPFDNYF